MERIYVTSVSHSYTLHLVQIDFPRERRLRHTAFPRIKTTIIVYNNKGCLGAAPTTIYLYCSLSKRTRYRLERLGT